MESYWNEIERMFVLKESSVCIYLAMIYINKWTYETRYSIPINDMYPNHFQESIWHILKHVAKYNLLFVFWRGLHYLVWKANTEKNHPPHWVHKRFPRTKRYQHKLCVVIYDNYKPLCKSPSIMIINSLTYI